MQKLKLEIEQSEKERLKDLELKINEIIDVINDNVCKCKNTEERGVFYKCEHNKNRCYGHQFIKEKLL